MVDQVESDIGAIDVLVNSAGAARRSAPADLDAAAWHAAMDAKYFSYIHPLDAVLKRMAARGRGAVVNIIGSGGKVANPVHLPGGAANAALMLASTGLAAAFAPKGIRDQCDQSGHDADRARGGGSSSRIEDDRHRRGRAAETHEGEDSARPARDARGSGQGRALPRLRCGELRDGRDRADGWRGESRHLKRPMLTDIEIAQRAKLLPIGEIAARLGIPDDALSRTGGQGEDFARMARRAVRARPDGKLILVSAISPTPAGEGKTTTTVGLGDALQRIGKSAADLPARAFARARVRDEGRRGGRRLRAGRADGGHQPAFHRRLPRDRGREQPARRADRQPHPSRQRVRHRRAPHHVEARRRHERSRAARDHGGARRRRQRLPAAGRLRHRRRLGGDGDLLPRRVARRSARAAREDRRRVHAGDSGRSLPASSTRTAR